MSGSRLSSVAAFTEPLGASTVARLTINRPPVNSFDMELTSAFTTKLKELIDSKQVDAIVLESSLSKVFSAGLDFKELRGVSDGHLRRFWLAVRDMWLHLYMSPLPVVAAIGGHCLAGGTLLAAACDHRIAAQGEYKIGVTAAKIGLVPPHWFLKTLTHLMGQRATEQHLQCGQVFTPDQAIRVGLVDEVCDAGELMEAVRRALEPYLEVCHDTRTKIKLSLRRELVESFHQLEDRDVEEFVRSTLRDSTQQYLSNMTKSS